MKNLDRWYPAAWALGIASVLMFPAGRNMRMMALFVTLLCFAALRLRPWFAVLAGGTMASWILGVKADSFGWTEVLMILAGLAAADYAAGQRREMVSALPYLMPLFWLSYCIDRATGHAGVGTLDNSILAGPILALLSLLVYEENRLAALGYAVLACYMESTTGALVLLACYTPMLFRKTSPLWVALGSVVAVTFYVVFMDTTHIGYGERLDVIMMSLAESLKQPLGHGWGSFPTFAVTELPRTWAGEVYAHAHSDVAQLAYEAGLPLFALVAAYCLHRVVVLFKTKQDVALGALLGLGVFSSIGFPWHVAPSAFVGIMVLSDIEGRISGVHA